MKALLKLFSLLAITCLAVSAIGPIKISKDTKTLATWLEGDFDNKSQARSDTSFDAREWHIRKIWDGKSKDAIWLYAEQLSNDEFNTIYAKRFFQLMDVSDGQVEILVYVLDDERNVGFEWKKSKPFESISPDDLESYSECTINLSKKGETKYIGGTIGKNCTLGEDRSSFTTVEMTITETKITYKETGFDEFGDQKWGPSDDSKGYEFRRSKVPPKSKK